MMVIKAWFTFPGLHLLRTGIKTMATPNKDTNGDILGAIIRSLADWHTNYQEELKFSLGDNYDGFRRAEVLAAQLRSTASKFGMKRLNDTDLTRKRQHMIGEVRRFLSGIVAMIKIVFIDQDRASLREITRDFMEVPPSKVFNLTQAGNTIRMVMAGLEQYRENFDCSIARTEFLLEQALGLAKEIEQLNKLTLRGTQQTRAAKRIRDETLTEARTFIKEARLAAQSISFQTPEASINLKIIFDTHNPVRKKTAKSSKPTKKK